MTIHSYSSPFAVGHKAVAALFDGPVVVEEKVDGSQFSFKKLASGDVLCRSRGQQINMDAPEGMFARAVESVLARRDLLRTDWTYRGEYLQNPKHNSLAYERAPDGFVILFDIDTGDQHYLSPADRAVEAVRIGLECVPVLHEGPIGSIDELKALLPERSVLGGAVEGIVVKNYAHFAPDKKTLMGKYVTGAFKETHAHEWKKTNPTTLDVVHQLIADLKTDARWEKAIQHLREAGTLDDSPRDIGPLLKEVQADVKSDSADYIRDRLFAYAWPHIARGIVGGLPEWYKERVLVPAFPEAT